MAEVSEANISVLTLTNPHELERIRPFWENWQYHPNHDFEHYRLVCDLRKERVKPFVLVAEKNGEPIAALVGREETGFFSPSIGYLKPLRIAIKSLSVIYRGVLGEVNMAGMSERPIVPPCL